MPNTFLFGVSLTASFLAGVLALFAPCCITFLFPSYLGTIFKNGKKVMWYTLVFAAGLSVILVPIALGFRFFVFFLDGFHAQVYYAGALILILMGIMTARPLFHLPSLVSMPGDWQKNVNTGSVFFLGLMSGLTSSCCAPVLFAAVTLTALSPTLLEAGVVAFAYVLGIVFPLFVLSLFYDKLATKFATRLKNRVYNTAKYLAAGIFVLSGIAIFIANARGLIVMDQMAGYSNTIRLFVFAVAKHVQNPFLDTGIFAAILLLFLLLLFRATGKKISIHIPHISPLIFLFCVSVVFNIIFVAKNFPVFQKNPEQIRAELFDRINPQKGYDLGVKYGSLGPNMLSSGVIDLEKLKKNQQLSEQELRILTSGQDTPIIITRDNAYFLLNFFWAVGLSNHSTILTQGPMQKYGGDQLGNFASTGGWTLGQDQALSYYAKDTLIPLTQKQEELVLSVAQNIYRPCCDNPTSFPDCNHGMALLGLLELLAANGKTEQQLYDAAKYVNAFWFPSNYYDLANYFYHKENRSFADIPAQTILGKNYSSASGWQGIKKWLGDNGYDQPAPSTGGSCGT